MRRVLAFILVGFAFLNGVTADECAAAPSKALGKLKRTVKQEGLPVLPDSEGAVRAGRNNNNSQGIGARDVSGTPPLLVAMPELDITTVFWRPGVIDAIANGDPTPEQCQEFHAGAADGRSGGYEACHMTESVGHSLQLAGEGATSLCYMKNAPTAENFAAGGISLVAGELPGGDVAKLFAPPRPSEAARVVKVNVSGFEGEQDGEEVFIKVHPSGNGNLYKVDLWFCREGSVRGSDQITISNGGRLTSVNRNVEPDGSFASQFEGYLAFTRGEIRFDSTRPRTATAQSVRDEGSFKAQMTLSGTQLNLKVYDSFGGDERRGTSITRFSGKSPEEVRFREGAFRQLSDGEHGGFTGATEYRDSFYAAVPGSSLVDRLPSESEMDDDPFFEAPAGDFDFSEFSCDTTPDVEVAMDMTNETLRGAVAQCEERPFDDMHFCWENPQLQAANAAFPAKYLNGPPPEE